MQLLTLSILIYKHCTLKKSYYGKIYHIYYYYYLNYYGQIYYHT